MAEDEGVTVWRAEPRTRLAAYAGAVLLALLGWRLVAAFGWLATAAVLFALGVYFFLYWGVLRPRLTAGPDGVVVVLRRTPVVVAWRDIRRAEASATGLTLRVTGGTEVQSRWPQRDRGAKQGDVTAADAAASYLVRRADWERKPTGPRPTYVPPPPLAKKR